MRVVLIAAAAAFVITGLPAQAETPPLTATTAADKALGSLYLRCDGSPNNVTGIETFGRLLAITAVVGLLLPPQEVADPSKRLFGVKGVEACSRLIDDTPDRENNGLRRLPLILARAVHYIEAEQYQSAIDDVNKARGEAAQLGLVGNPYFERSLGLSFNWLEGTAKSRTGDLEGGRDARLQNFDETSYSFYAIQFANPTGPIDDVSDKQLKFYDYAFKLSPVFAPQSAYRLEYAGRFKEAAEWRERDISVHAAYKSVPMRSSIYADAAVTHALANNWAEAQDRAQLSRANLAARRSSGRTEQDEAATIEKLDLYAVLVAFHEGRVGEARRLFGARSEWVGASPGSVNAAIALLSAGAQPAEKAGLLATPLAERKAHLRAQNLAAMKEVDKNKNTLFSHIAPYAQINGYESMSKQIWNTKKSKIISNSSDVDGYYYMLSNAGSMTQPDALLLHAALQAKARGFKSFEFNIYADEPMKAWVSFEVGPADPAARWLDPDTVIAALRRIIPSPEELTARRAVRKTP